MFDLVMDKGTVLCLFNAFSWVALVVRPWHSSISSPWSNLAFKADGFAAG